MLLALSQRGMQARVVGSPSTAGVAVDETRIFTKMLTGIGLSLLLIVVI